MATRGVVASAGASHLGESRMTAGSTDRRTGAAPRNRTTVSIAMAILVGLGVLVGASTLGCEGLADWKLREMRESQIAFWDVCQGQGTDYSAEYVDNPAKEVHKVAAVYPYIDKYVKTPAPSPWFNNPWDQPPYVFPNSWRADNQEEAELVVCIYEPVGRQVSDCGLYKSSGGERELLIKYQYSRYVELRVARTGELVASTTIQGAPPDECRDIENGTGYEVKEKAIEDWLRGYVEHKKE
jgi:hypothetical protein